MHTLNNTINVRSVPILYIIFIYFTLSIILL